MKATTMREIWQRTVNGLRLRLDAGAWELHVQPLRPVSYSDGVLTLASASARSVEVLEVRLDRVIRDELQHQAGRAVETRYRTGGAPC